MKYVHSQIVFARDFLYLHVVRVDDGGLQRDPDDGAEAVTGNGDAAEAAAEGGSEPL